MPAWDNAQIIGPPSLVPPKADFSALGDLGTAYYQGQQLQRQKAIQNVAKDLPDNPTQEDYAKVATRLFRLGDYAGASQLYTALNQQDLQHPPSANPLGMPTGAPSVAPSVPANAGAFLQSEAPSVPTGPPQPVRNYGGDNVTVGAPQPVPDNMTTADAIGNVNRTGQVVPGGAVAGPPPDPNSPLVPRPVQTVPGQMVRPQPVAQQTPQTSRLERETGISPMQVAQARQVVQSNPAATSAVDPMLPPQWKGNPMGFINDQATQAIAWDRYATKQELAKAGSGAGSKDIAKQFSERAKAVLDALAPTGPMKEAAQAGATSVADYELKKKRAEDIQHTELANAAERWKGIFGVAQQYEEGAKTYVDRAKSVLNQPKTYTGFGGDTMQDFNKFRAIYGDTQGALYGDALAKLNSMNVLATIGTMKSEGTEAGQQASRIFAGMVDEARKTGVNINTSIAGNRFLAEMQQRLGEYAVRKRDLAQKYKAEHGGALDDNFNQVLKKDMADHPLFTKAEQQNPSLLGIPTTPYDSQGQTRAWAQQMGIKDGDPIRTPGGKIVTLHIPIYPKQQSAPP